MRLTLLRIYLRGLGMLRSELGLTLVLVAASAGIGVAQLAEPVLFGRVVDVLAQRQDPFGYVWLWAGLGLVSIVASVVVAVFADRLCQRLRLAAMSQAFERAITLPVSYHAERGPTPIVRSILVGADTLFGLWLAFFREHTVAVVSIACLIPTAISIDPRMALLLGLLALVYTLLNAYVVRQTGARQQEVEQYHQDVFGRMGDVMGNITVVQSYARLSAETASLRGLMKQLLAAQYPVLTWWAVLAVLNRAAGTITMVAVFLLGSVLVSGGELSVGEIVSFVGFAGLLISKLDQLSGFVGRIFMQAPVLRTYFTLVDVTPEIREKPGAKAFGRVAGDIAYESVTYRFGADDAGVFDLSFTARRGETVAIVGPTGSGKTTSVSLLQRLRDVQGGRIAVDGKDIRDVTLVSLRKNISVVFQDAGLFNRTIAENIRVGRPGASDREVEAAAKKAEAHEFISGKAEGYGFVIGQQGAALSGGQQQRIAIARAILKDAPILLLDEATSALDVETEGRIKQALDAVRRDRTTIIIAHRLSTIMDADKIIVLDGGRIVQQGRFAELSRKGLFARMVKAGSFTVPRQPAKDRSGKAGGKASSNAKAPAGKT